MIEETEAAFMTTDAIGIGTVLYLYEDWRWPRQEGLTWAERQRACMRPCTITGETRGKWLAAAGDTGEYEINKRTLKMCGRNGGQQFYTAAQLDERLWSQGYRRDLVRAVETCDTTTLRKVAAAVGYVGE